MPFPLFFHSFRVDFQHSAWKIRHTNHSQLLMEIAQTVEELVQNKKKQLKPSKTWEKPVMNSAEWIDLSFLFLNLPNYTVPTSRKLKRQTAMRKWEMVRVPLQFHVARTFRKLSLSVQTNTEMGDPVGSTHSRASGVSNGAFSTWKKRQIWCSSFFLSPFKGNTIKLGENMQHTCLISFECMTSFCIFSASKIQSTIV